MDRILAADPPSLFLCPQGHVIWLKTIRIPSSFQVASQACITESYQWGLIQDSTMLWIDIVKWVYISTVPGVLCSIVKRISIYLLLISIFVTKFWLNWWLIVTTTLVAFVGIASIAVTWSQTKPVEAPWSPRLPETSGDKMVSLYVVFVCGASFALTDFIHVSFPVIIIWHLRMPLRRTLGLCILMASFISSVATCITCIITAEKQNLFLTGWGMLWASIEQSLVVLLGSGPILPALRKLDLGWYFRSLSTSIASLVSLRVTRQHGYCSQQGHSESSADTGNDMVELKSRENSREV